MILNIQQAAERLDKSTSLIRRLIRQGRIEATAIGTGRRKIWQIEESDLLKYRPNKVGRPKFSLVEPNEFADALRQARHDLKDKATDEGHFLHASIKRRHKKK